MVQKSKWIQGDSPADLVSRAARRALELRLELVWHYLPWAADEGLDEPEVIHQLRVSTRRAQATMECYQDVLPPRRARWMNKQLNRVRKAAGDARDYDVLVERLAGQAADRPDDPSWQALLARVRRLRNAAQAPVGKVYRRLAERDFEHRARKLVKRVRWRGGEADVCEPSFSRAAGERMRAVVVPFFSASQHCDDVGELHQFRILSKRVRYAMEVFAEAFDASFRDDLYPLVEQVQERLGAVNDHATAIARYQQWLSVWDDSLLADPLTQLLDVEHAALAASQRAFQQWWTAERADELRRRFEDTLSAPARLTA